MFWLAPYFAGLTAHAMSVARYPQYHPKSRLNPGGYEPFVPEPKDPCKPDPTMTYPTDPPQLPDGTVVGPGFPLFKSQSCDSMMAVLQCMQEQDEKLARIKWLEARVAALENSDESNT